VFINWQKCHSKLFASCHSEGEKQVLNEVKELELLCFTQDKLREESKGDSSPVGLRMTNAVGLRMINVGMAENDAFQCHPERSEGSGFFAGRAQNDKCRGAQNDKYRWGSE